MQRSLAMTSVVDKRMVFFEYDFFNDIVTGALKELTEGQMDARELVDNHICPEWLEDKLSGEEGFVLGRATGFLWGLCSAWGLSYEALFLESMMTPRPTQREIIGEESWAFLLEDIETKKVNKPEKKNTKKKSRHKNSNNKKHNYKKTVVPFPDLPEWDE
jgi:hypothetical protein